MAQSTSPSLMSQNVPFASILCFWKAKITSRKPSVVLNSKKVNADFGLAIETTSPLASIAISSPNGVKPTKTKKNQ
jgi:hypothetical protein